MEQFVLMKYGMSTKVNSEIHCLRPDAGVTLVEMMVATALLVMTLGGFMVGFTAANRSTVMATDYMNSMHKARQLMEMLSAHPYDDSELNIGTHTLPALGMSNTYVVAANPTYASTKDVTATVFWTIPARKKVMSLSISSTFTKALHLP